MFDYQFDKQHIIMAIIWNLVRDNIKKNRCSSQLVTTSPELANQQPSIHAAYFMWTVNHSQSFRVSLL